MQNVLNQLQEQVRGAVADKKTLRIQGGNSKAFYGEPNTTADAILDTRAYTGIIDYDPAELVITARCGTPLVEIEAALAQKGQILPFEPPHFSSLATLGGCIAAGIAGPRRAFAGAIKDFVLGTVVLTGKSEVLSFGGQVMKNVAGYDVSRVMAGSLGTLGVMTEVSLKVLPKAVEEQTLVFAMDEAQAIHQMNTWMGQALPLSGSLYLNQQLYVRLSGARAAVSYAAKFMGGESMDADSAALLWQNAKEQTLPFFADLNPDETLWRLSVPDTTKALALPESQLIEWGGAQRWLRSTRTDQAIRQLAKDNGGHATIFKGNRQGLSTFTPQSAAIMAITQRLQAAFDPAGVFNRKRLFADAQE